MSFLYLTAVIFGVAFQNIVKKPYTQKTSGQGAYIFSLLTSLASLVFFVITSGEFAYDKGLIKYALFFALSFATSQVFVTESIACGSLSLTSLLISYSLMLPTFYGLFFLKDPVGMGLIPGIVLLIISLYLTNKKSDESKLTFKWAVYVFLAAVGNGMCSVVQKMQQVRYAGLYKSEFMIISLAMVVFMLGFLVFCKERKNIGIFLDLGWKPAFAGGIANGMVNLFVMIISELMPASLMFPLISVGGIIVTYLVSKFYYREQLTKTQTIGLFVGLFSVVFLNI